MIKLTFDTNILLDYLDPSPVRSDERKICEIRVVSRLTTDVPDGSLRERLDQLSICQLRTIPTVAQWGISEWHADFSTSDDDERKYLYPIISYHSEI